MNIIFGTENVANVDSKFIVLELDTIRLLPIGKEVTAYCLVEHVAIPDMPRIESMKDLHVNLLKNYKNRDWNFCIQSLEHLVGFWGGEVDTFYGALQGRIAEFVKQDPGDEWDPVIDKILPID